MAYIGIDLGTTNSLAAIWQDGKYDLIPNALGEILTPSAISLDDTGKIIIGSAAKDRLVTHPDQTIAYFKRWMGTTEKITLGNQKFLPEELSAFILKQLKEDAEVFLDDEVQEAIISVPAYFNDNQRNSTLVAAQIAGINVERLINEPTAAAIAYGIHEDEIEKKFIVIDLGGGTFDVSIMEKFDDLLEVHASAGDSFLGGEDFTENLFREICKDKSIDYSQINKYDRARLYRFFEKMKCDLSSIDTFEDSFELENSIYECTLTREQFFKYSENLIKKLLSPIERSIRDANIKLSDLDDVFLVGGATRMPLIRQFISRLFGRLPSSGINPDHVVAIGASIQVALKQRNIDLKDIILTDVCPFSMGIETTTFSSEGSHVSGIYNVILERNQVIPVSRVQEYSTIHDNQTVLLVKIFQGENRLVKNNIQLGEIEILVPKNKAGMETIDVRFTYDINGLLEVIVKVNSTNKEKTLIIKNSPNRMTEREIQDSLRKLDKIKIHPRDNAKNQALISRAERLYKERLSLDREDISLAIIEFEQCLERQDEREIEIITEKFEKFLLSYEEDIWV